MISTLGSYSDKVSDISFGSIYGSYILTFFLAYTMILSDMFSWLLFGIYSILTFFLACVRVQLHPELAIWLGSVRAQTTGARDELLALDTHMLGERRGGLAPLKSRDPHLAGARLGPGKTPKTGNLHGFKKIIENLGIILYFWARLPRRWILSVAGNSSAR